ncbi:hypothetical protein MNBD_ALPHA11-2022 [hydrothermal vent metagenome]|uniref:Uncharacterized protein n=1 Tax=hydrothermal vent metagenome TaxID=652676 RepID=A0A3B0UMA7_9ZZZZ
MSRWHLGLKVPWQQGFNVTLFVAIDDGGEDSCDVVVESTPKRGAIALEP